MDTTNIFTVTPMNHNLNLDAGEVYEGYVTVANPANAAKDFNYKVAVSPYAVVGEDYTADFLSETARTQIADWVTVENPTGTLKPNETVNVKFKITVPETAPAGGQYAALMVSSNTDTAAGAGVSVNNVFEMASIIYANISGDTIVDGEVIENTIPGFVTATPIRVSALLENNGNAHEIARINLEVRSFFSATPIYPTPGESGVINEVIMPETSRYVTRDITGISPLGVYEVTQTINYLGENHQVKQVVVACPIWFMALVLLTVIGVVATIVYRVKAVRRKKRVL